LKVYLNHSFFHEILQLKAPIWRAQRKHHGVSFSQATVNSLTPTFCNLMDSNLESMKKYLNVETFNMYECTEKVMLEMVFIGVFDIDIRQLEDEGKALRHTISDIEKM